MALKSDLYAINGKAIYSPQTCTVTYESLADENSGRTDDGIMHINWIWRKIRKVTMTFPPLTAQEIAELVDLVQGQEYELTYPDMADKKLTIRCYTSNSNADLKYGVLYGGLWVGFSFSAIELEGVR